MIDLAADQLAEVRAILGRIVPDCEVRAFGSRVDGRAGTYSDLDLALLWPGGGAVPEEKIQALKDGFSASSLPIMVDVHDWSALSDSFRAAIGEAYELIQHSPA
jgi:predicted nucleotidyltransferase